MTDPSPLSLASPDALTALFSADPLTLTDAQLTSLVVELRRRRSEFHAFEAAAALKPKTSRAKPATVPAPQAAALDKPIGEVDLGDLL